MKRATVVALVASLTSGCNESGFSNDDITKVKQSITDELGKRPTVTVLEVQMLKEGPRKLTGFARLRVVNETNILNSANVTKACSATMGDDGERYIWRCE